MAFIARDFPVRPDERKLCLRVIEARQVCPGFHRMAGFASARPSVGAALRHLRLEFAVMRILMAACAGHVAEVIRDNLGRPGGLVCLVAFRASDSKMRPGQREARFLVQRDCIRRWLETVYVVARFAPVRVWRSRKLTAVRVLMAIGAFLERNVVARCSSCRNMAFVAGDGRMLPFQRVSGELMLLHAEE